MIAFSLTTNWYLRSDFKDLSFDQKAVSLSSSNSFISRDPFSFNPYVTSISSSQLLEICWLNTSLTFSSSLLGHMVSSCNILLFMLSIPLIILVLLLSYQINSFTISKAPYLMGQSARLEENFVTNFKSFTKMAPERTRPYCYPRRNPSLIDSVEDELARDPGPVRDPHSGSTSPVPSCNPTPGPNLVLAVIPAPVFAPTLAPVLTDELFKKFIKAYLESNQGPR